MIQLLRQQFQQRALKLSIFSDYISLVQRLGAGGINRSENDLSSNLKGALSSFGLFGVIDTASGNSRFKRPDIALYTLRDAADVSAAADVVVESKKPSELQAYGTLIEALVDDVLWADKFVPYVTAHIERISFFILTTFERVLVVTIPPAVRAAVSSGVTSLDRLSRMSLLEGSLQFDLMNASEAEAFERWCSSYLTPEAIQPPALSSICDLRSIERASELEAFASDLADIVVGRVEGRGATALIGTVRAGGNSVEDLAPEIQSALTVYTMAAHGGMSMEAAQAYLASHWQDEWSEFVSASVHSLIGRLFAIKAIEDGFCLETDPPLIPSTDWIFHSNRFDNVSLAELPNVFFASMGALSRVENTAVKDLAATGRFYDWLGPQVDPSAFRRLVAIFTSHNFSCLDDDLLGRFFEIYAQRVDRRRRKQLGQYYTPVPIVRHMWRIAIEVLDERGVLGDVVALDPGVGSGTFLIEGANSLHAAGLPRFWERLTGFDISPQAIGIAQINVYLAVLAHLDRREAEAVGTLNLYPTDALDPRNGARLRTIMPLLTDESTRAFLKSRIDLSETVKQRSQFPLVIGNPPYRNNSNQTLAQVAERFPVLLRSSRANARARKRNIRDDYAWFFAAADHYVAERGIIAFVVSDSFCYASSYRYFREDLLRRYKVRHLAILGASIFRDVGPRTQFVVIILERRDIDLTRADDVEAFDVFDLRPLAGDTSTNGTEKDARLIALERGDLPEPLNHRPGRIRNFALFPEAGIVRDVEAFPNVLHGDSPRRVFVKKWPGIITAFDELFRGDTSDEIGAKAQRFFEVSAIVDRTLRESALDDFASSIRATSQKARSRLSLMAEDANQAQLTFDPTRVRRVVTGSAPNEVTWYPDTRLHSWVYYEPGLRIPRNVHEGRDPGYGTMSQWRDAASHGIGPKFVFTTGTNPDSGLKALLVPGDWMVKSHGGESQQFHYTGLDNPLRERTLAGPNNLGADALSFYHALMSAGFEADDILFYLAGIYNSQTAEDYLEGGGQNVMRIPLSISLIENGAAGRIIDCSKKLRNLHWLAAEGETGLEKQLAETLASSIELVRLGFEEVGGSGGRFKQRPVWRALAGATENIDAEIVGVRPLLDEAVSDLYHRPIAIANAL
ncbi:N-6 DNA methylase [Agrobacterium vaccinii]|uniref:Eco57I restriction-modification methylase domain-containing protein n=1 Tax=Agrobacterium vaccinii TaxID=2735528 RepID=UPI001E60C82E|nr:N-6 DNA methylase [Agrobacterium vaccinii]UHS63471.1 N-6 DNA methylase [Agrobacterium vaccinii]